MHCTWNIDISKTDWLNYPAREENSSQEVYIVSIHVFIKPKQTLTNKGCVRGLRTLFVHTQTLIYIFKHANVSTNNVNIF